MYLLSVGCGYHLIIVKGENCKVDAITDLLNKKIGNIVLEQNVGAELSYSLPEEKATTFGAVFTEIEKKKQELGIGSYGASITTMEEIFIKYVTRDDIKTV